MAQQKINFGTPPKGEDGDTVWAALQKVEANFDEIYAGGVGGGGTVDLSNYALQSSLDQEVTDRQTGDQGVRDYVDQQIAGVVSSGGGITQQQLDDEASARAQGDTDVRTYVDQQIASINQSGSFTYKGVGAGAVTRTLANKLTDLPVSVVDYYNSTTDGSDYGPALTRALAVSSSVYFPRGFYKIANPVSMANQATICGDEGSYYGQSDGSVGTTLSCPNGFLLNPDKAVSGAGARKHMKIHNLHIYGNASGKTAIDGQYGGEVSNCKIERFGYGVYNPASFLTDYFNVNFASCTICCLALSDFNGGSIRNCSFGSSKKHIDVTLAATDGGGAGFPYEVCGNLFNGGSSTANMALVTLVGTFKFEVNYYEEYASADNGQWWLEILGSKWDETNFSVRLNEFNAHGKNRYGLLIRAVTSPYNHICGSVTANRFLGLNTEPVHLGDPGATTNNSMEGIRIFDNNTGSNQGPTTLSTRAYRPIYHSRWQGATPLPISGSAYTFLPIGTNASETPLASRNGFASDVNTVTIPKNGVYRIWCYITAITTGTANLNNVGAGIFKNGTEFEYTNCQLIGTTGGDRASNMMVLGTTQYFDGGDLITVKAHNGDAVSNLSFAAEWICDQDCFA